MATAIPAEVYNPAVAFDDITGIVDQLGLALVRARRAVDGRPQRDVLHRPSGPRRSRSWSSWTSVRRSASARRSRRRGRPSPTPGRASSRRPSISIAATRIPASTTTAGSRRTASGSAPTARIVWNWHPSVKERRSQLDLDWWALLRTIATPTLVLRGESSPILDRDVAERMAKELPNGRFVEIPRAVHTLHEDNPEAVLDGSAGIPGAPMKITHVTTRSPEHAGRQPARRGPARADGHARVRHARAGHRSGAGGHRPHVLRRRADAGAQGAVDTLAGLIIGDDPTNRSRRSRPSCGAPRAARAPAASSRWRSRPWTSRAGISRARPRARACARSSATCATACRPMRAAPSCASTPSTTSPRRVRGSWTWASGR